MDITLKPNYIIIPAISFIILALGRYITYIEMTWYNSLSLPSFTPNPILISLMWQIIFTLTTAAALIVWNKFSRDASFWIIVALFTTNAVANALWTYLFFAQHAIGLALIDALLLESTVLALISIIWQRSKLTAILLMPYALWVAYACILNASIYFMN